MPLAVNLGQIFLAEFMGTAMLILLGTGVVMNVVFNKTKGGGGGWLLINFGWGLAVFSGVIVAFHSGGHLNPAVTIGLAIAKGGMDAATILVYIAAQFVGAFVGAALAWLAYKKQFDMDQPEGTKLGVFATGPAERSLAWNLVTEIIATFVLVFVILLAGYGAGQYGAGASPVANMGWLNAFGVALLIVAIGASLGGPTGYAINPARDLGPRIWHAVMPVPNKGDSDWGYSWVPVVGPCIGAVIAAVAYLGVNAVWPM